MDYLYIDYIVSDWREAIDNEDDVSAFVDLANQLGAKTPDELVQVGHDFDGTLIPERDFVEYAQELAYDIGALKDNATWPYTCIDWDHAAVELSYDYNLVTYDGTDYYILSY